METLPEMQSMRLEKAGKKGWLTFCRPSALNAVNSAATEEIDRMTLAIQKDSKLRVVVVRGEGRAFSTGIDLKELAEGRIDMSYHRRWERALRRVETSEKIFIAGLHGYCLGGALQLALACDIRVATPDCRIGLPAIRESLIPGLSTWRLPRYVGWGRAKKMILGGESIDGETALSIGLVDHLADDTDFFTQLDRIGDTYLGACSTGMRMSKLLLNRAFDTEYPEILSRYFRLQKKAQYSPDAREASRAYLAGDDPKWK